jgi:hypothetical protein
MAPRTFVDLNADFTIAKLSGCGFANLDAQNVGDLMGKIRIGIAREKLQRIKAYMIAHWRAYCTDPTFDLEQNRKMSLSEKPVVEGSKLPTAKNSRATLGISTLALSIGIAATVSWFLGPNALGQDATSHASRDNTFLFMVCGPIGLPVGLGFLFLWLKERRAARAYAQAEQLRGEVTHLWKEAKQHADRKYRVGYAAPGIAPQFVCVSATKFKRLSIGDVVDVRLADGKPYVDL